MTRRGIALLAIAFGCTASAHQLKWRPEEMPPELRKDAAEVSAAYEADPNDACVLYQVASLLSRAGRTDDALLALRKMAAMGTGVDPRPRDGFAKLASHREFESIVASIRAQHPPVSTAREAFSIEEGDLVPEGIAWSQLTERLYLGSVKRKIVAVDRTGHVEPFVETAKGGLGVVLGLRVDDRRGELWAASGQLAGRPADAAIGLFRFRLSDGELIARYPIAALPAEFVNDIAVAPDGRAYATLTAAGTIVRVDPAANRVDRLLSPGSVPDANGIAVSPDGKALFVASWHDIFRIDLADLRVAPMPKPRHVASGCFDGLYAHGNDLVGIQNCVHATGRVVRLHLDRSGTRIEQATVLESYNPLFDGITTGAIAGDTLFFIANVQFRKMATAGAKFDPLHVLALPLTGRSAG